MKQTLFSPFELQTKNCTDWYVGPQTTHTVASQLSETDQEDQRGDGHTQPSDFIVVEGFSEGHNTYGGQQQHH